MQNTLNCGHNSKSEKYCENMILAILSLFHSINLSYWKRKRITLLYAKQRGREHTNLAVIKPSKLLLLILVTNYCFLQDKLWAVKKKRYT